MSTSAVAGPAAAPAPPVTPDRPTRPYFDSPIATTLNSIQATVERNDAKSRYRYLAADIESYLVGPMPLSIFLEKYLPKPPKRVGDMSSPKCAFELVPDTGPESELNDPLTIALNIDVGFPDALESLRCPGIRFFNTGDTGEDRYGYICGYLPGDGTGFQKGKCLPGIVQIFVELKLDDFACDCPAAGHRFLYDHITNQKKKGFAVEALGQQVSYAIEVCARQHRNFLFSIFMTPTHARFLRWDRAGVVISRSFNYKEKPEILCDFLWRFGHMTDAQRGCDTTVSQADPVEEAMFANAIVNHVNMQLGDDFGDLHAEYARHYEPNRVVKITIRKDVFVSAPKPQDSAPRSDATGKGKGKAIGGAVGDSVEGQGQTAAELVEFLVSRPVASPASLASRATRGYWAFNIQQQCVQFLKDAWRTDMTYMITEGQILGELGNNAVQNVPTLVCCGDVDEVRDSYGCTETNKHKSASWNKHRPQGDGDLRLTPRVHYRQVIAEAGYSLDRLAGTRELLSGARDVLDALQDAHSKCNRLHRDVSAANIILFADPLRVHQYPRRKCILIDWEFSCPDVAGPARDHWRSGTWAFMSISALQGVRPHHVCDDVESLIYVIFYCAIHCLPWTPAYDLVDHANLIANFFDQHNAGRNDGGNGKEANLAKGTHFQKAKFDQVSTLLTSARRELLLEWNKEVPNIPSAARVFEECRRIFERTKLDDVEDNNKELHARPYHGPAQGLYSATTSFSSHHAGTPSPMQT